MKNYMKYFLIILFVLIAGFLHSCSMKQDKNAVTIEKETTVENMENSGSIATDATKEETICVFVTGCVTNPGVYEVSLGTRLYQLIEQAGGFTEEADEDYLNLADTLQDGEKILIYSKKEAESMIQAAADAEKNGTVVDKGAEDSTLVNINTATKDMLMTLPGIGESKAEAIISYREENGKFSDTSEIMNISGIKEGAFSKIKDFITV